MNGKKRYKILVVDDDPTLCLIAEKKLSQFGYQVLIVSTGKEAIDCALEQAPDLLLLDYELPDMTGVDVCRHLRGLPANFDNPILFFAGKEDYQSIENAFLVGATDFCRKPLNWTILIYRIQYLLRGHEIFLSLMSSEARLSKAQKIAKMANWDYNFIDKTFKCSNTICNILDREKPLKGNIGFDEFLDCIPNKDDEIVQQAIDNCLKNHVGFELEHELITDQGNSKTISHTGNVIRNELDVVVDIIGTIHDVTERRIADNKIRDLAYFDSLTKLMNRESFLTVLERILSSHDKLQNQISALLFIDLDDFKRVNDTLGHDFGDLLLCEVAERITSCVRTAEKEQEERFSSQRQQKNALPDNIFRLNSMNINRFDLARLGGDEFTVFLADIPNEEVITIVANRLLKALEKPFDLNGHEVFVTFSVGIAIAPRDGEDIQSLLKNADTAMYSAKAHGKNNFKFYTPSMNDKSMYRLTLESDLRHAISNNDLYLVYQPQICLQTGQLVGAEALLRWNHKTHGNISPVEFIPLAEETGQILRISDWLFEHVYQDLQDWKKRGLIPEKFKLALNVSSLQFYESNMMDKVRMVFSDLEMNKHINFELTESVMMKNTSSNLEKLDELVAHNISLSLDDFGTGFSSLSYLHRFPVDTVKIDRSFISNLENNGQVNIIKAIVAMAHGMNINVIGEGIENQWQYDFLRAQGCDVGQGFFMYKPLVKDNFQQLLGQK